MRVPTHAHIYSYTYAYIYARARARDRTLGWAADKRRKSQP